MLVKPERGFDMRAASLGNAPLRGERIPFFQSGTDGLDYPLAVVFYPEAFAEAQEILSGESVPLPAEAHLVLLRKSSAFRVGQIVSGSEPPSSSVVHQKRDVLHMVVLIHGHDVEARAPEGLLQRRVAELHLEDDAKKLLVRVASR